MWVWVHSPIPLCLMDGLVYTEPHKAKAVVFRCSNFMSKRFLYFAAMDYRPMHLDSDLINILIVIENFYFSCNYELLLMLLI